MAHSQDVKARAMAALLSGQRVATVARQLDLPKQTVSRFKQDLRPFLRERCSQECRERIEEMMLDCIKANLRDLTRMAEAIGTPEYIGQQTPCGFVALYREMDGFVIRLLEAASAVPGL